MKPRILNALTWLGLGIIAGLIFVCLVCYFLPVPKS